MELFEKKSWKMTLWHSTKKKKGGVQQFWQEKLEGPISEDEWKLEIGKNKRTQTCYD